MVSLENGREALVAGTYALVSDQIRLSPCVALRQKSTDRSRLFDDLRITLSLSNKPETEYLLKLVAQTYSVCISCDYCEFRLGYFTARLVLV